MADKEHELVLKPTEGKVRKRRKPMTVEDRLASPTMSQRLLGRFMVGYQGKWGFPYAVTAEPRDLSLMKKLGEAWGEQPVSDTILLFFTSTDPQVRRCRFYNVPDFFYWAPKLRMAASNGGDVHDKTASNIHEISKAMGRKP